MSDNVRSPEGRRFHHGKTVHDLDARFAEEDKHGIGSAKKSSATTT